MRILVICAQYPMHDRASGDYRLTQILRMLAKRHSVALACYGIDEQYENIGRSDTIRYRDSVADVGVAVTDANPPDAMHTGTYDAVFFEFYYTAARYISDARILQRKAVKIVDSVDVHYNRIFAKAALTGSLSDRRHAEIVKEGELAAYRQADHVITTTDHDRDVLLRDAPSLSVEVIPNIHPRLPLDAENDREPRTLLFVGGFTHDPNVDAALYLHREIMPLVWEGAPDAKLRFVGNAPPEAVRQLAGPRIEVLGYVPDIGPYLRASQISVAPLRYGGGMKGKIGEAMAAGLPVVTTSVGAAGFGAVAGEELLIADSAADFAAAVCKLFNDVEFYDRIRRAGWHFISNRFSPEVIEARVEAFLDRASHAPVKVLTPRDRVKAAVPARLRRFLRSLT